MSKKITNNAPEYLRKETIYLGESIQLLHNRLVHHLEHKTLQDVWDVLQKDVYINQWINEYRSIKQQTIRILTRAKLFD